jgi:hypothetical protein
VVADIKKAVAYVEREKELADPVRTKFAVINRTAALNRKFDELGGTVQGVQLVWRELSSLYSLLESRVAELRGELALRVLRDCSQPALLPWSMEVLFLSNLGPVGPISDDYAIL